MNKIFKNIIVSLSAAVLASVAADAQIVATKRAVNNYDGTFTLIMEAYATGSENVVVTESKTPLDAVLVLDVSGSMSTNDFVSGVTYSQYRVISLENFWNYYNNWNSTTWVKWSDGNFYRVYLNRSGGNGNRVYTASFTISGVTYTITHDNSGTTETPANSIPDEVKSARLYYGEATNTTITRMQALKNACNIFLQNIHDDQATWNTAHPDKPVTHRVSIVQYAGGGSSYNPSTTLVSLANGNVVTNYSSLTSAISDLSASGATYADDGMSLAAAQISASKNDPLRADASRLVLFFTDGEPGYSGYDETRATSAIANTLTIKNAGATVYSLTVQNLTSGSNTDKFMDYISSNFPSASSMSNPGDRASNVYYAIATNQTALNSVFNSISNSGVSGGTSSSVDASASVQDVISPYFMLPAGAESAAIKVKLDNFKQMQGPVFMFNESPYTAVDASNNPLVPIIDSDNPNKVSVSGFDFKDNWCGVHVEKNSDGTPKLDGNNQPITYNAGKKLIMEITIVPDPDASSDGAVPTNDDTQSGIYSADGSAVVNFNTVPSKVYTNADLVITVANLEEGESAIFKVTANTPLNLYGTSETFERTVVLTSEDAEAIVKAPVTYKTTSQVVEFVQYTVEPMSWSWTYDISVDTATEDSANINGSVLSKTLYKEILDSDPTPDNVFHFIASKKTGLVLNGEGAKDNEFQWHNDAQAESGD